MKVLIWSVKYIYTQMSTLAVAKALLDLIIQYADVGKPSASRER